jgi:hypothetical protein
MKHSRSLIAQLRVRLAQGKLTDAEFTVALAEILAATTDRLSGADSLVISKEIRELERAWRESVEQAVK